MKKIYLAGPDVFRSNPKWWGEHLKRRLLARGFEGLYPFDNEVVPTGNGPLDFATRIYQANVEMIRECDAVLANITPFRGPSLDAGTAFEIGFAKALGKPVIAYEADTMTYKERVEHQGAFDAIFTAVEDFGLTDNLMIACSCDAILTLQENLDDVLDKLEKIL